MLISLQTAKKRNAWSDDKPEGMRPGKMRYVGENRRKTIQIAPADEFRLTLSSRQHKPSKHRTTPLIPKNMEEIDGKNES